MIDTEIADIIFQVRKEENPCSLCAKMRKGALNTAVKELGCNKVAYEMCIRDSLGAVPDDEAIVVSTNRGEPLVGSSAMAGIAYSNICKRILGYDVPLMTFENKTGFFSKVSGLFRR